MIRRTCLALATLVLAASLAATADGGPPEARLLRFPDIHDDFVVFVYAGDLWRAPSAGGTASRLTTHAGQEIFPKISPDGRSIAFSAEYTGSRQVYVMPAWGGPPRQLTFYNDVGPLPPRGGWDYWVLGWTAEGKILVRMNRVPWGNRMGKYFLVDPAGGLETPLPLPEGGSASLSPDGKRIAYTPIDREFRTWKRTMGGRAQDVWVFDLLANRSERITDWKGTDNFPMWSGQTIYFTSDRDRTLNIFAYDLTTKAIRRATNFDDFDVLWPSLGPGGIVFMNGGFLHKLDLATGKTTKIDIRLGADMAATVPFFKEVRDNLVVAAPSPSGARIVVEARGEIFSVPAKDGATRNMTRTAGAREISPAWSPDGTSIAYLSDESGEYEIYLRGQDGSAVPRRLTTDGAPWRFQPLWSPDSRKLAWGDARQRLRIIDVETGKIEEVDRGTHGPLDYYRWSPDSKWLLYEITQTTRLPGLAVYSLETRSSMRLGDGMTADFSPVFSSDGRHLFFLSNRNYTPTFSDFEFNYVYNRSTNVFAAALDPSAPALFPPKSDEEKPAATETSKDVEKSADTARKKSAPDGAETAAPPRTSVMPEGFAARTAGIPGLGAADYRALQAVPDALFYLRGAETPEEPGSLWRYDLKERKEEKVVDGVSGYEVTADRKKLLYRQRNDLFLVDAKPGVKPGDGKVDLSGLRVKTEPKAEWAQMYRDGWRIVRDWFYDERLHGVDWEALGDRYAALVPYVASRADLDFVFGELIGELEAGHTYVAPGDEPRLPRIAGGMLGCEFEADPSGRYRIARVYPGENWDETYRSPLTEPGVAVGAGEFLLAIDGTELTTGDNPYRLLEDKAGKPVVLRVAASSAGPSREVTVRPVASEQGLRYLDWVRSRMALVDELSGGAIGYIHLPDTALGGNRMLQKLFYAQAGKAALIIDDRYNGGGFIPDRMIEYFSRRTLAWWARRDIESMRTPGFAHNGPKAMLINGHSSSGGDALPHFFRLAGLGPIIGTRTWGGLIGLSGNPGLMDGGAIQVPTFRIYDGQGAWIVENEGVAPDIEVIDLPERRLAGGDPSVEKAVEVLLEALKRRPFTEPDRPVPPVMTK